MTIQPVTINLPDKVYQRFQRAARRRKIAVNDMLVEAVAAAISLEDVEPVKLRSQIAQMAYLNDAALWQAARATLSLEQRERLAALHETQQSRSLNQDEQAEEQALLQLYQDTILVRAQAAILLKQRGYDVSDPSQFEPLE
jgi:DNA-binding helix-hairpin-helix protein with protein kinase domain